MPTPAARAVLAALVLVAAPRLASAERPQPLPGAVGLVHKQDALRNPCTPGATFRTVKRVKAGDDAAFVKAMTYKRVTGLDFDPEKPRRVEASNKKFVAWIEGMTKHFGAARQVQEKILHDPASTPAARVAAAARIAILADQSVMLLASLEVPPFLRKYKEAEEAFCDRMDEVAEPLRTQAADARAYCASLIAKHTVAPGWWTEICVLPPAPSPAP